jgi:hypothetical protein
MLAMLAHALTVTSHYFVVQKMYQAFKEEIMLASVDTAYADMSGNMQFASVADTNSSWSPPKENNNSDNSDSIMDLHFQPLIQHPSPKDSPWSSDAAARVTSAASEDQNIHTQSTRGGRGGSKRGRSSEIKKTNRMSKDFQAGVEESVLPA